MNTPRFSIIIPVYNRPQELEELLTSLQQQSVKNFEVIVVEDGSAVRSDNVVARFSHAFPIRYIEKPNSGPGPSRNEGYRHAQGEYFVVFDSDCLIPPQYFEVVDRALTRDPLDAWGGPDRAHENFTRFQRAMGYTMASVLTTGGIRGGKRRVGWFQPRSFNMGISRKVFEATGGFHFDRYAEDIEFSIRMKNHGFRVGLIPEAFVYHKRRTNAPAFFRQVFNFGKGRALIGKAYPSEVKLVHWFPTVFSLGFVITLLLPLVSMQLFYLAATAFGVYFAALFVHALFTTRHLLVALLALPSALLQFFGYGTGFLIERLRSTA